jgi:hypothetical protein
MVNNDEVINANTFRNKFIGVEEHQRMLIPIFKEHNHQMQALIDKEFALNTYKRYETSLSHIQEFLKYKYLLQDIHQRHQPGIRLRFLLENGQKLQQQFHHQIQLKLW